MTFLIFWAAVGLLGATMGGSAWASFAGTDSARWPRRVALAGAAIFLICGSLAALAQDLVS